MRRAWYRGHRIEVHGLVYGLDDGLLRRIGSSVNNGRSWMQCYEESLQAVA
jgi:carbonic anhydrase